MTTKREKPRLGARIGSIDTSQFQQKGSDGQDLSPPVRTHTGVGMVMGAIAGTGNLERQLTETQGHLAEAKQRLAAYDSSVPALELDPAQVRRSKWANRDELNFKGDEWAGFKSEIQSAGGNVQPIKVRLVRPFDRQTHQYEIVFGHRRHQACLELGLPVLALVEEDMNDLSLFTEMDRENRQRENLSAWEQGRMYNQALSEGLFPSQRQLAENIGVNLSDLSRACTLAKLPEDVVKAFPSPLALQVRMAKPLNDKLQSDPDGVLERARALHQVRGTLSPAQVIAKLLGSDIQPAGQLVEIQAQGTKAATFRAGAKGRAVLEFEPGALPQSKHEALIKLISEFLAPPSAL